MPTGSGSGGRRLAAALRYAEGDVVPVVTAKGRGAAAERIVELAERSGVDVVRDDVLVSFLDAVQVGDAIPAVCFEAVARIIAFVRSVEDVI